jgi:hypothetical protein
MLIHFICNAYQQYLLLCLSMLVFGNVLRAAREALTSAKAKHRIATDTLE